MGWRCRPLGLGGSIVTVGMSPLEDASAIQSSRGVGVKVTPGRGSHDLSALCSCSVMRDADCPLPGCKDSRNDSDNSTTPSDFARHDDAGAEAAEAQPATPSVELLLVASTMAETILRSIWHRTQSATAESRGSQLRYG